MLAWLPEHLLYGSPYIVNVVVVDGLSVAKARDDHYHNPPEYLVIEPEDTRERTRNLQQTNTNGYILQNPSAHLERARRVVDGWGAAGKQYKPTREYQKQLNTLMSSFKYRLDTNYAKMDRIAHLGVEEFKTRVCATSVNGMTVAGWARLFASVKKKKPPLGENMQQSVSARRFLVQKEAIVKAALEKHLQIVGEHPGKLLA